MSRGRVQLVGMEFSKVRQRIKESSVGMVRDAMLKDFHLLEAALGTHQPTIVSRDGHVRQRFCDVACRIPEIQLVHWANPDQPRHETVEWLRGGATPREDLTLGHASKKEASGRRTEHQG